MLEIRHGSFSSRCEVLWSGQQMGVIDLSFWTTRSVFYASDGQWTFRKQGTFDHTLLAEQPEGNVIAWAAPVTFWGSRWTVATPYGGLMLRRRAFGRTEVESGDAVIGAVDVGGWINGYYTVQVPPDVHLWVQVFIGWVVLLWQRQQSSSAAVIAST